MVKSSALHAEQNDTEYAPLPDAPLKWCSIALSDVLSRGKRLEASVYDVDAMRMRFLVTHGKYQPRALYGDNGFVKKAYYGARLKRNYVASEHANSIGFIGSSEMLDVMPMPVKFMVNDQNTQEMRVKRGTVLLSRSGTIGNIAYVNGTLEQFLVSEHAMRLECADYPGYVYAFLKSKAGQVLVQSNVYGAVIQEIEPEHLTSIPVPDAPGHIQERVHVLIDGSYTLRDESNELVRQALSLLVSELQLPSLSDMRKETRGDRPVNAFCVPVSELKQRADASFHVPVIKTILRYMRQGAEEVTTIGDGRISKDVVLPGRFKRVYVDKGHGCIFIGGKQLWEIDPSNKKYLSIQQHGDRIAKQLELHENMTLITCSGTIGKVALVGKQWEKWTANQHIIRIIPAHDEIAGYISIFLLSEYGRELITHYTYGSVIDEIDDAQVRDIPFPLLKNREAQAKINALALLANEKRYQAYCMEQQALHIVNEEVLQLAAHTELIS